MTKELKQAIYKMNTLKSILMYPEEIKYVTLDEREIFLDSLDTIFEYVVATDKIYYERDVI